MSPTLSAVAPDPAFGRRWRSTTLATTLGPILVVGSPTDTAAVCQTLAATWPDAPDLETRQPAEGLAASLRTRHVLAVVLCAASPGVAAAAVLDELAARDDMPPIVVTGCASDDAAVDAVRRGAHDALVGPAPGAGLRHALRCAVTRSAASAAWRAQAVTDPVTGLPNRTGLMDRLGHAVASARRRADAVAVLFVDLDGFKGINDRFGHEAGDQVLQEMARRLRARTRDADTVARLGGDEFVVVMEHLDDVRHAATMAAKLLDLVRAPLAVAGEAVSLSASIGISVCPEDGLDGATLLRHADTAMYAVKAAGKNGVRFASPRVHEDVDARARLDAKLRQALLGGELELHYQPRWHAGDQRVSACESLLRWRQPGLGLTTPAEFLEGAEASGAIVEIGRWALREACQQARRLADAGFDLTIAVKVSARQLLDAALPLDVSRSLQEVGLTPSALQIEVPEAALSDLAPTARGVLGDLRALGVPIVVDHFGTGQSSLASLQAAPITGIKIDGRLVRAVEPAAGTSMPAAIVALARHLQLEVIADGVETEEQVRRLREAGCELMQGYYYGRALPPGELMAYLRWACTAVVGTDRHVPSERADVPGRDPRVGRSRPLASTPQVPPGLLAERARAARLATGRGWPSGKP